jgi:hypothetical protein
MKASASGEKKTDEGKMVGASNIKFNAAAVAAPSETQMLTSATTQKASNIVINGRNCFRERNANWEQRTAERRIGSYCSNGDVVLSPTAAHCLVWGRIEGKRSECWPFEPE